MHECMHECHVYALCMMTKLTGRIKLEVNQHRSTSKYSENLDHMQILLEIE
jgi:hypothetical protein